MGKPPPIATTRGSCRMPEDASVIWVTLAKASVSILNVIGMLDALGTTLAGPQDLGGVLGRALSVSPTVLRWALTCALAAAVFVLTWRVRSRIDAAHWVGGVMVGLIVGAAFFLTGSVGFLPEHPETLEAAWLGTQSKRPEALSFSAPMGHALDLLTAAAAGT
jgi:hypothetical protein